MRLILQLSCFKWRNHNFETEVSSALIYNSQVMFQLDLTKPATIPWHISPLHTVLITLTDISLRLQHFIFTNIKHVQKRDCHCNWMSYLPPFLSHHFQPLFRVAILVSNLHYSQKIPICIDIGIFPLAKKWFCLFHT